MLINSQRHSGEMGDKNLTQRYLHNETHEAPVLRHLEVVTRNLLHEDVAVVHVERTLEVVTPRHAGQSFRGSS